RARYRRGGGAAPAARHRGGRRFVRLATADAVHHAGRVPLSRPDRPRAEASPRAAAPGSRGASTAGGGGGGVEAQAEPGGAGRAFSQRETELWTTGYRTAVGQL